MKKISSVVVVILAAALAVVYVSSGIVSILMPDMALSIPYVITTLIARGFMAVVVFVLVMNTVNAIIVKKKGGNNYGK